MKFEMSKTALAEVFGLKNRLFKIRKKKAAVSPHLGTPSRDLLPNSI
jgi:hypothetical protein